MADRIPCVIATCTRTMGLETYRKRFGHEPGGWICPTHWSRATKSEKRVAARLRRLERKLGLETVAIRSRRVWNAIERRVA